MGGGVAMLDEKLEIIRYQGVRKRGQRATRCWWVSGTD